MFMLPSYSDHRTPGEKLLDRIVDGLLCLLVLAVFACTATGAVVVAKWLAGF
jgi:hypothetical protein